MPSPPSGELKRTLGSFDLIVYGVGDILGAGIYVLVGKMAGLLGNACWMAFGVAFIVASLTGLSYAELGSRFPKSAGESIFALEAFRNRVFSYLIGFLVLLSGVVSMATVSRGFAGYVNAVWPGIPPAAIILIFFIVLAIINFWGMELSSRANMVCTFVEVAGILIVITAGMRHFGAVNHFEITLPEGKSFSTALFQGSVLGFYAFIGFEDIVNVAEETHQPTQFVPRAILTSLGVVAVFYFLTALAAVSMVPSAELAQSSAPLMKVVEKGFPGFPPSLFILIALCAVSNTALVNFIMGSRLLYGMARERLVPSILGRVHPTRHTPHFAIATVFMIALILALTGTVVLLAQSASFLLLAVFFVMNVSLFILKLRAADPLPSFRIPIFVPVLGALSCLFLVSYIERQAYLIVFALLLIGLVLYGIARNPAR